jgi:phosphomethylpyrimidine synthase
MRITQDLREEALRMTGMEEKSKEFVEKGADIYVTAAAAAE